MSYRYENIRKTKLSGNSTTYFVNAIYPDIPLSNNDNYVITTVGDRLDLLAFDIYKDQNLWWVIASANNLPGDSIYPPVGMQLRLPSNIESAINRFNAINGLR
jgi:nucleoid-associated protein YgaU